MSVNRVTQAHRDASAHVLEGRLLVEGDERFDRARRAWNLAVDQRPAAVVSAADRLDVVAAIAWARERGLRVAPQGTGHGAAPLGPLQDTVLVRTGRMREVRIDPVARIARLGAGVVWEEAVDAAAAHGLALLAGSAPDVGVVGYTLGGGLSWLGRTFGLASSSVLAIELVTADGRIVRTDHDHEPDLFWALRGGGGSFGIVTAIELRLLPIADVYAGVLWWPIERGEEVLQTWRELTTVLMPDELTTVARLLRLPAMPDVPEPVRGRSFVVVEAFHLGDPARADALLAPLRALGPENDTLDTIPVAELGQLHMDPPQPVPGVGDGILLSELPTDAIDRLVALAGVGVDSPLLSVELRQLGGELARSRPESGALSSVQAPFLLYAVGIAPTPASASVIGVQVDRVRAAMAPWASAQACLNFAETPRDPATLWSEHALRRLRQVKARVDPDDLIRSNHPILGPG